MSVTPELIAKFLNNSCTAEEAERVASHLRSHPHDLEKYFPIAEWGDDSLYHRLEEHNIVSQEKAFRFISEQLEEKQKSGNRKFIPYQIAASVSILFMGIMAYWYYEKNNTTYQATVQQKQLAIQPTTYYIHKINAGNSIMKFSSADGSQVALYPGGEIRYPEYFDGLDSRDFELKGKARFSVAKDTIKPFVVHSNNISTRALGTAFIIDAPKSNYNVKVTLLTGKVLVQDEVDRKEAQFFSQYMKPGDVLLVNTKGFTTVLNPKKAKSKPEKQLAARGSMVETDSTLTFNNQSLQEVFSYLEDKYLIRIRYEKTSIKHHYYSGFFKKETGVEQNILNDIVLLNDFWLECNEREYIIK